MKRMSGIFNDEYSRALFHTAAFLFYRKTHFVQRNSSGIFSFSILGRGPAFLLPEQSGKIQGIVISYRSGNITDGQFSFLQQTAGPADTEILLLLIDSSIVEIFVNVSENKKEDRVENIKDKSIENQFKDFYFKEENVEPSEDIVKLFMELMEEV